LFSLVATAIDSHMPVRLTNEKKLIKNLIEKYPIKWGRPFANDSDSTLMISFGITLIQIIELDAGNQMLVTNVWTKYVN
jgi:nicotinic acetylcholine receptor, invertebrate